MCQNTTHIFLSGLTRGNRDYCFDITYVLRWYIELAFRRRSMRIDQLYES